MTKVTYYMYSCDACCKIREMMEIDDLDSVKCQVSKIKKMGRDGNYWKRINDNKKKLK